MMNLRMNNLLIDTHSTTDPIKKIFTQENIARSTEWKQNLIFSH
jgi:hypothetical protein